ncbi:MAG: DUF5658 family protein [Thermoplasmata archaeon]
MEIDYNWLYRLGTDFVANEDVRWLFGGKITLYGNDEYIERDFWFFFQNISYGYFSDRVSVRYGPSVDFGNKSIIVDEIIRFHRPGEYVLRVVDRLQGSEVNFTGYGRVLVADELVKVVEDFKDDIVGSLMIISGLLMILLLISVWDRLKLVDYWGDANREWKAFWRSGYSDILIVMWTLVGFDILTTFAVLSHGGWELNDIARKDMYGTIWFTVLFLLSISFLAFFLRGRRRKRLWKRVDIWIFGFVVIFICSSRTYAVINNLEVALILAGWGVFWTTLGTILLVVVILALFLTYRLAKRRKEKGNLEREPNSTNR